MTHDEKIDWIRAVDAANIHIREADMMHACVGSQTVVAADALIRSQAEQIATLDTECLRLGIEEAKLQTKAEMLTSERDALAAMIVMDGFDSAAEDMNLARKTLKAHDAALVGPLYERIAELEKKECSARMFAENRQIICTRLAKEQDNLNFTITEKDAEILRLENSILEADDYRTETGERDTVRAYRHINAEAAGIREEREKIEREKS